MKQKKSLLYVVACIIAGFALVFITNIINKDTPPKLSLNGTELDLSKLEISDLNKAGFWLSNNDASMSGSTFRESLSYYWGDDRTISMGGVSVLNRRNSTAPYVNCDVFEITAKSQDKAGNPTGLQATYEGKEFFGKTKEELIALFGEPAEESVSYQLVYRSKKKQYKTTFYFDTKTHECYLIEINRRESNLVR